MKKFATFSIFLISASLLALSHFFTFHVLTVQKCIDYGISTFLCGGAHNLSIYVAIIAGCLYGYKATKKEILFCVLIPSFAYLLDIMIGTSSINVNKYTSNLDYIFISYVIPILIASMFTSYARAKVPSNAT